MRTFFALELDDPDKYALAQWRDNHMGNIGRPIRPDNFHVTLCFLGDIDSKQHDTLTQLLDQCSLMSFSLVLDRLEYLPRNSIVWLGATETPGDLSDLVKALRQVAQRAGIKVDRKTYRPHITLFRNCTKHPDLSLTPPTLQHSWSSFSLFKSTFSAEGVRYDRLHEWRLQ